MGERSCFEMGMLDTGLVEVARTVFYVRKCA